MKMVEECEKTFDPQQVIEEFEELSKDAGRIQEETLQKILEENGRTEYLQQWSLNGKTEQVSFKNCVPIVTHKDLEPYIHRIADGDLAPILTGKTITTISLREFPVVNGKALQFIMEASSSRRREVWQLERPLQTCTKIHNSRSQ
ncbi:hypothetical protein P3S67_027341 [Capsicum chacoense]